MQKVSKVSLRHNPKNWENLYPDTTAILLISPGQAYYEGERLAAVINALNYYSFKECHVMIGDTNYRHTMKIWNTLDEKTLHLQAKNIGLSWVQENLSTIKKLIMPSRIIHWDTWLSHPLYHEYRQKLNTYYNENLSFKNNFLFSAEEFLERYLKNKATQGDVNKTVAIEYCLEYLKEECTIIMPLWASLGYKVIVYPSNMLDAMKATYEAFVSPYTDLYWLTLRNEGKKERNLDFQQIEKLLV